MAVLVYDSCSREISDALLFFSYFRYFLSLIFIKNKQMASFASNPTSSDPPAPIILPDESYKGTFVTDVYDPMSKVKQPDFLHFPESIYKVLKQIHPDIEIDLGAMYVMEDYNRHLLRSIAPIAARFASEKRCAALADYVQAPNKNGIESQDFKILGQDGARYLVYRKDPETVYECGWEDKHVVKQYLEPQVAEWETKDPTQKKNVFDEFLCKVRKEEEDFYPGGIDTRDIQTAVRLSLPDELAKHAVSEGTKAVTKFTSSGDSFSRSCCSGLQFDVDQIGTLMCETTGKVVTEGAACYLSAVMEYMTAEALELSGNAALDNKMSWIIPRHIMLALRNDNELNKFANGCTIIMMSGGTMPRKQNVEEDNDSCTVAAEHVLSACARQGSMFWGTGRLPLPIQSVHPHQLTGPDSKNSKSNKSSKRGGFSHEFSRRLAQYKSTTMPCQHKDTCGICLNTIPRSYPTLSCGHKIHPRCMRQWNKSCPLCRKIVPIVPYTRREEASKIIYRPLDDVLDPLWRATKVWRNNPLTRNQSNINEIWKCLNTLLEFIWKNRNVLRRDYKFIETMKKRSTQLIEKCQYHSNSHWHNDKKTLQTTKKFQDILARI